MTPFALSPCGHALIQRLGLALITLIALALGGCGPGVGGSGSGSSGGGGTAGISFTAGDVCEADFMQTGLACTRASPLPGAGTLPVSWIDTAKAGEATVSATLEGHDITLDEPCAQIHFTGTWGSLTDGQFAFVGTLTDPAHPDGIAALATVSPERSDATAVGWVALFDADRTPLHPAWLLYKTEDLVAYAACAAP